MTGLRMTKLLLCMLLCDAGGLAAQHLADSTQHLGEVEVQAYFSSQPLLRTTTSAAVISRQQLDMQQPYSLVPSLNTIAGVRMEERSPGSYRLSIRGSLLRSPFGIRNIKVYMDAFPLTDGGGNTYFNLLDAAGVNRIEILKGPEASIFGANSGGVILIAPAGRDNDTTIVSRSFSAGSYATWSNQYGLQKQWKTYRVQASLNMLHSNGYRENSNMNRYNAQFFQQWNYVPRAQLKAFVLYSTLNYRTPGGLTLAQFEADPQSARPATPTLPSAEAQHAGVRNNTFFGGLAHEVNLTEHIRHVIAFFGSHTDFENPFITNDEARTEYSAGTRTYLEAVSNPSTVFSWKWQTGLEIQQTHSDVRNYGNMQGVRDTMQASDELTASQHFFFTRFATDIRKRWSLEAALSLNFFQYKFRNAYPLAQTDFTHQAFDPQLMPRIGLSYLIHPYWSWRASVSRGYSAPTLAEVRPSDNIVHTGLQPESGWNYETGFRMHSSENRVTADVVVFYYQLDHAIVRRVNEAGNEYFINAGGTAQWGLEAQLSSWLLVPRSTGFFRGLRVQDAFTFNYFLFRNYHDAANDYSANRVTGVPRDVNVVSLHTLLPSGFYLFAQYNYTAPIPLNDANTAYANEYHLVQLKGGWQRHFAVCNLELFAGVDNLLDQSYSLGNDLNAVGGRYYNPAPARNYYGGFRITL